jgi:hypothetical protein
MNNAGWITGQRKRARATFGVGQRAGVYIWWGTGIKISGFSLTLSRCRTTERFSAFSNASYLLSLHIIIIFIILAAGTGAWSLESDSTYDFSLLRTLIDAPKLNTGFELARLYVSAALAALHLISGSTQGH